eukprot:CAMPEP_0197718410 /NCGR_PEP_ID=MMETSP1434-20131217/2577_1 /TAXON_ID=265543 /ORGANISM="Minutocellus polymorphus, Strain CCMP3303" /LENGTH=175 /DNA_ID=CAMNT_0043303061 /DNA_START=61 /DNA_END=588 /DNA_ORIENTATION=+
MAPIHVKRKERHTGTCITNNNSAEVFLRQIGLSKSQEEEALSLCRQHLVSSASDLVLIYKRGELTALFPQLGLHARIEAQLKHRSVALGKNLPCLLDTTAPTISSSSNDSADDDDDDGAEIRKDTSRGANTARHKGRNTGGADSEVKLERLVRDWFERTKRKALCYVNEHRCSTK